VELERTCSSTSPGPAGPNVEEDTMTTTTRRRRRRPMPAIRCFHVFEAWGPHEGCREFMTRPDVFVCRQPATHVVKGNDPYEGRFRVLACREHVDGVGVLEEAAGVRAYRFRTI
jgi:hypothetical protein